MDRTILVTGGAGYIGSHTALELIEAGDRVVVADNLINSSRASIAAVERLTGGSIDFVEVDLTDRAATAGLFQNHPVDAVIHFAGLKAVGESTEKPLLYYRNNLVSTMNLLDEMAAHEVFQLVFSSSATVYGDPEVLPIPETAATGPTNAYGRTKLMIEDICRDVAAADPRWRISLLRYFNPVGAHQSGDIGEDPNGIPNNLVPYVMQVAVGRREKLSIFGGDYNTADGTGVRDYIHVIDLAAGHIAALDHLPVGCREYNLGTGVGASVLEVVTTAEAVSGRTIPYEIVERRAGDIATSLADPRRANEELEWRADRSVEAMLTDAWRWQSKHPDGYPRRSVDDQSSPG
ncbi:MAG: UDP-glucose 4-epimerase GalE [Acidimicrobiales bacterium]|nr:UDP-glucose 4-epimerase GalE [Acidimicrobiales bacterium]